jgi:hypothetical protein
VKVFKSYGKGIKEANGQLKMLSLLWLVNFIFGSVLFFLLFGRISRAISESVMAESLLKRFDFAFLFEFMTYHEEAVATIFSAAFILMLLYLFISIFLYGGILSVLTQSARSGGAEESKACFAPVFFQGAGKYFGRFFRLSIYSMILWFIFAIFMFLVTSLIPVLTAHGTNEQLAFYLVLVEVAIALFLIFLIKMILDYTRIKIVTEDSRSVFISLFKTIWFVLRRAGRTLGLYYLLLLTGAILWGIFWLLDWVNPSNSLFTLLLAFVVGQLFIASRGWLKIAFQSAQLDFYSPHTPDKPSIYNI